MLTSNRLTTQELAYINGEIEKIKYKEVKMEETQNDLYAKIGTEEIEKLKPKQVRIEEAEVKPIETKKGKKAKIVAKIVKCRCKHPDREERIEISSVRVERNGKLEEAALWVNKDSKGMIQKGCPLALFLQRVGATNINELTGKEVETMIDDKGYLCFKGY